MLCIPICDFLKELMLLMKGCSEVCVGEVGHDIQLYKIYVDKIRMYEDEVTNEQFQANLNGVPSPTPFELIW